MFCTQASSPCSRLLIYTRPVQRAARIRTLSWRRLWTRCPGRRELKGKCNIRPGAQSEIEALMLKHQINAVAAVCTVTAMQQRIPKLNTHELERMAHGLECWICTKRAHYCGPASLPPALDAPNMQAQVHCNVFAISSNLGMVNDQQAACGEGSATGSLSSCNSCSTVSTYTTPRWTA